MRLNRLWMFLTFAAVYAGGCAESEYPVTAKELRNYQAGKSNRYTAAEDAEPPKILPATYFAAGQLLERQGRLEAALFQYNKAILVGHNYVAAHHRLGMLLSELGRHDEALAMLRKAASLAPSSAVVRNNLGYELMLQEQWEEAEQEFARATELDPKFARAFINHGMALSKLGRFDDALASFRAVLPEADAQYNIGLMYRGQQRYDDAKDAFARALEINPNFIAAATQLEQLAPRLEQIAWNAPEPTGDSEVGSDPFLADGDASDSSGVSNIYNTSESIIVASTWVSTPMEEARQNPWTTTDVMADSDRSILDDEPFAWEGLPRDFYGPVEMPSLDLSRASSPPTIAELNEALSIVRNEIACLEDQSSEYGMSAAHYGVSEYGIADSSPAEFGTEFGMQSFESWLNDGSGSSRRKTMGMTIIPSTSGDPSSGQESQQSGSHDSTDDPRLQDESSQEPIPFVGPPAPGDGQ